MIEARMPPFTKPGIATCSAFGVNLAMVASPSQKLRRW